MGGLARLRWRGWEQERFAGRTDEPPWFASDSKAWADWVACMDAEAAPARAALGALGLSSLIEAVTTDGMEEHEVQWATPDELERAARTAHELLLARDLRFEPAFAVYCGDWGSDDAEAVREMMAQDLLDVAAMAAWGRAHGKAALAIEVNW